MDNSLMTSYPKPAHNRPVHVGLGKLVYAPAAPVIRLNRPPRVVLRVQILAEDSIDEADDASIVTDTETHKSTGYD